MKLYDIFGGKAAGKGVSKDDARASVQTDFAGFFVMFKRKFWNISNLNLLMAVYVVFLAFGIWKLSTANPIILYSFLAVAVVLFGLLSAGTTYITRGYVRGDPVYLLSDFKYAIKHNWLQAISIGIIDILIVAVLLFDIYFWSGVNFSKIIDDVSNHTSIELNIDNQQDEVLTDTENNQAIAESENTTNSFIGSLFFYACIFLLFIYLMMRNYIYLILVTFKLSIFKIFKNSFIFAFLGFKRNILSFIGISIVCLINFYIFTYVQLVGILLTLIITAGTISFIGSYAAYPVIKKYMIAPYYNDEEVYESYDKIFEDRG